MTHTTEQERAEFEVWARNRYTSIDLTRGGDDYSKALAKDYWSLWQAARRAPAAPVPQGWQPVPIEPTQEMQDAMHTTGHAPTRYAAMLAAAPQPPEADHIPDAGKMVAAPVPQGLREAAQAVVERWDTPLWKDVPPTAVCIADLRAALAAAPQPPEDLKRENHATKPEAGCSVSNAETVAIAALEKVLRAIQRHLPPERIGERETIAEIISIVDPWPLGKPPAPWKDHRTAALVNELRDCAAKYGQTQQLRERIAYIVAPLCAQLKTAEQAAVNQQLTTEAAPVQLPENLREGAPYDNPAFEALARALGVWGTAQSAVCAQFWIAAKEQST